MSKTKTASVITTETSVKLTDDLTSREQLIRQVDLSFIIKGTALVEINQLELYKQRNYTTFELYCERHFDMSRDYAYKLISATKVYRIIKDNGFTATQLPKAETHVRPLTALRDKENNLIEADIIKNWSDVVKDGVFTAKAIKAIVNKFRGIQKPVKKDKKKDKKNNETGKDTAIKALKDRIVQLENDLDKAKKETKSDKITDKTARQMIQAGFKVLCQTATEDQQKALIQTKKTLLG